MEQNISRELSILERREDEHVKFGTIQIPDPVTGITEITKITEITTEITEITMEIPEITIKGWGGGDVWCGGVGRCE